MKMTKLIKAFLCVPALLAIGFSSEIAKAQETTLRVMSMHIRHAEGSDGQVDLSRIVAVLRQGNADLIALQGVDRGTKRTKKADQARLLAMQLKMNYIFAKTQREDGGETGNVILSRFPIGSHKILQLPKTSNNERGILVALIKTDKGTKGKEIRFASTALGGGNSGQIRQLEKLNDYFFIDGEDTPVIIGTHMYITSQNKSVVAMREKWTDSFEVVERSSPAETLEQEGPVEKRINYIFFRTKDSIRVTERRIWADPFLAYPAVLAVIVL